LIVSKSLKEFIYRKFITLNVFYMFVLHRWLHLIVFIVNFIVHV